MDITVAITTYNEGLYLDGLLSNLSDQKIDGLEVEIILLEAGQYQLDRVERNLELFGGGLTYLHREGLSRTNALNNIFKIASGDLIIRLDARSRINNMYLQEIFKLSRTTGAENVGGAMLPIGLTHKQKIVASLMSTPLALGGSKSRNCSFKGFSDSLYLGAYNRKKCEPLIGGEWFDSLHGDISEDSDLNYRIRQKGGKIFIDSDIVVEYYARESLRSFFLLCYKYGFGRGLFLIKHKSFSAFRQVVPLVALLSSAYLFIIGFYDYRMHNVLIGLCLTYWLLISTVSIKVATSISDYFILILGFIGCHLAWTLGLLKAIFRYMVNNIKRKDVTV